MSRLAWLYAALLAVLLARLVQMQLLDHEQWREYARQSRTEVRSLPFHRGAILDRRGAVLAEDRRSYDFYFQYRAFRQGHLAGQLLEVATLLGRAPGGLDQVWAQAEALAEQLLDLRPEELRALPPAERGDVVYYLRLIFGLRADEQVSPWVEEGQGPLSSAFAGLDQRFAAALARGREQWLRLEVQFAAEGGAGEPLLARLESERRGLEWLIRQRALREAAGRAFLLTSAQVSQRLAGAAPQQAAFLDDLARRWSLPREPGALAELRGLLHDPAASEAAAWQRQFDRLGALLRHLEQFAAEELRGLRRRLIRDVHSGRVARLARDVSYDLVDLLEQNAHAYPGLYVEENPVRSYPGSVAPHLVGLMRQPREEELLDYQELKADYEELARLLHRSAEQEERYQELRDLFLRKVRRPSDALGASGVEWAYAEELRGERGYRDVLEEGSEAQELSFVPPRHGRPVRLALDRVWQEAAEDAIRRGYELVRQRERAAAATRWDVVANLETARAGLVLLDLRDGTVPVLATVPSYTVDDYRREFAELQGDRRNAPLRHRGLGGGYWADQVPYPGSTFKLVACVEAVARDPAWAERTFECHMLFHPPQAAGTVLRCEGLHGLLDMHEAVRKSCNAYFYQLGAELGFEALRERALALGFGAPAGIEITGRRREDGGWELGGPSRNLEEGSFILHRAPRGAAAVPAMRLAIGQTYVTASPLQMARFYGWLATGKLWQPRLVLEAGGRKTAPAWREPPPLSPAAWEFLHGSLRAVMEPGGTGDDPEYPLTSYGVAGKTGTAQVRGEAEGGKVPVHGWFAGYFPAEQPRYALCVYCENAGLHGGELAPAILYEFLRLTWEELMS